MSDDFETAHCKERFDGSIFRPKGPTLAGPGDRLENPMVPLVAILLSQHRRVNVVKGHAAAGHFARSDRPVHWLRHMYSGCVLHRCHPSCGRVPFHRGCVPGMGRCVDVCSQEAIELSIEYSQSVDKSITRQCPLVDHSFQPRGGHEASPMQKNG
jgi:ferredoxin